LKASFSGLDDVELGGQRRKEIEELIDEENRDDDDENPSKGIGSGKKGEKCPSESGAAQFGMDEENFDRDDEMEVESDKKDQIFPSVGRIDSQSQF
jgi:hypothetical protein